MRVNGLFAAEVPEAPEESGGPGGVVGKTGGVPNRSSLVLEKWGVTLEWPTVFLEECCVVCES